MNHVICQHCGCIEYYYSIKPVRCPVCMEVIEVSKLGEEQRAFARNFPLLLLYAFSLGYTVTFPPEHTRHIANSRHFDGRAKDINLFKDGKYLAKTEDHLPLGLFWEFLGGVWGGRWNDGNHYSWGE